MNKLEKMLTFIDIVEANSFVAAARKQNISSAAVSKQMNALEEDLGVQLLKRTTRQVALTDVGLQYYEDCKRILADLREAENAIADSHSEASGILKVSLNRYFAFNKILPRLPEFLQENPKLDVQLEIAERFPDLEKEKIDLVYGVTVEAPDHFVRRSIANTTYILCASPNYLKQYGVPKTPQDLYKHRYISHTMRKPLDILQFKDAKEIQLTPYLALNDTQAMRECAIHGMGIIKLHHYELQQALESGSLVEILAEYKNPPQAVYLYYLKSRFLLPKIRRFIDFYHPSIKL